MRRTILVILIVLGLLLAAAPGIIVSAASGIQVVNRTGDGIWVGDTWEIKLFPGESKSTTLGLYNPSYSPLNVLVTVTPDLLDGGNLVFEIDAPTLTILGRGHSNVTLAARASGSVTPGAYTTKLDIRSESLPAPYIPPPYVPFWGAPPPTPVSLSEPTPILEATASVSSQLVRVWGYFTGSWQMYDPVDTLGSDLRYLTPNRGYWIKVKESCTLTFGSYSYPLTMDWSLIGWR